MGLPGDLAGARTVRARIILRSGRSRPGRRQREMRAQLVVGVGAYATTGGRRQAHPASRRTGRGRPFGSLVLAARSIDRPFGHTLPRIGIDRARVTSHRTFFISRRHPCVRPSRRGHLARTRIYPSPPARPDLLTTPAVGAVGDSSCYQGTTRWTTRYDYDRARE